MTTPSGDKDVGLVLERVSLQCLGRLAGEKNSCGRLSEALGSDCGCVGEVGFGAVAFFPWLAGEHGLVVDDSREREGAEAVSEEIDRRVERSERLCGSVSADDDMDRSLASVSLCEGDRVGLVFALDVVEREGNHERSEHGSEGSPGVPGVAAATHDDAGDDTDRYPRGDDHAERGGRGHGPIMSAFARLGVADLVPERASFGVNRGPRSPQGRHLRREDANGDLEGPVPSTCKAGSVGNRGVEWR